MPLSALRRLRRVAGLRRDDRGTALIEFAIVIPVLLMLSLTGAELTNYITVRMRLSQIALQLADNGARIGTGTRQEAKKVYEADIYDVMDGAQVLSDKLDLMANGRVIMSSLEPMTSGSLARIRWQRCKGTKTTFTSQFGVQGAQNLTGIGPAGRQATVLPDGVTIFVQLNYIYKPLVSASLAPAINITETASMMVRDRRDTSGSNNGIFPSAGLTPLTC